MIIECYYKTPINLQQKKRIVSNENSSECRLFAQKKQHIHASMALGGKNSRNHVVAVGTDG